MNEYDLINAYLNLIFDDSITYFSRILDEYRGLCQLRKWMRKRGINLKAIEHFVTALYQIDRWPGFLIFKGDECAFVPIYTTQDIEEVIFKIEHDTIFSIRYLSPYDSFFVQLSDLHLGSKKKNIGRLALEDSLYQTVKQLRSYYPLKFLITGDLMNSPNRKNMYEASGFMKGLKNRYNADVSFILGNHDVIVNGFNIKTKMA